ncbi:hypothetical protein [Persephonella sp.]
MGYQEDRIFTEYVHSNLALEKIYKPLKWKKIEINSCTAEDLDINHGIDRVFETETGKVITVQERFRTRDYGRYDDFTIRYSREKNKNETRRKSEFFKIKADYFVYGITNCTDKLLLDCDDFLKFAVIDMSIVKDLIENEVIIIDEKSLEKSSFIHNGKLITPVLINRDSSSEFIALSIPDLKKLDKRTVIFQRGFDA